MTYAVWVSNGCGGTGVGEAVIESGVELGSGPSGVSELVGEGESVGDADGLSLGETEGSAGADADGFAGSTVGLSCAIVGIIVETKIAKSAKKATRVTTCIGRVWPCIK